MRKITLFWIIVAMMMGSVGVVAAPSNWAVGEIEKAREQNLVPRNILGDYQKSITREEFSEMSVMLYEALSGNIAENKSENPFVDTLNPEVLKAYDLGIVKGTGQGRFMPDSSITREEIAVMFFRTLSAADPSITEGTFILGFSDRAEISTWARNEVGFMSRNGIINGVGSNTFAPKMETPREQAIALVVRIYDKYGSNQKLTPEEIGALSLSVVRILVEYDDGDFGYGSGFFHEAGKIATNYHVIKGAKSISIEYDHGKIYEGPVTIAGYDGSSDLAVLLVSDKTTKPLELGSASGLVRGQPVYAIGSPIGYRNLLTEGIISGITNDEIQVTLPLSEGSSGGALIDQSGKVVGITYARMYGVETLGFAIPSDYLNNLDTTLNLSLEQFRSMEEKINSPRNIVASQLDSETISIRWEQMEADYFKIYKSHDKGDTFQPVLNESGLDRWSWTREVRLSIGDYREGDRLMFGVSTVKDGVESEMNYSNYVALYKGMSESEIFDDLLRNLPSVRVEGYVLGFEGYDVSRTQDNKITRISAYISEESFETVLQKDHQTIRAISEHLKAAADVYSGKIDTQVELTVIYLGLYDQYPGFLEDNYINPGGVEMDPLMGLWEAEYPIVNVASGSTVYLTWYGAYRF